MRFATSVGLYALVCLATGCGPSTSSPEQNVAPAATTPPVNPNTQSVSPPANPNTSNPNTNLPPSNPNTPMQDGNIPTILGKGVTPTIGSDALVLFEISPTVGKIVNVATSFVIEPSLNTSSPAIPDVQFVPQSRTPWTEVGCDVALSTCTVFYGTDTNITTSSVPLPFSVGDTIATGFADLGDGTQTITVSNLTTKQSTALTLLNAPAVSYLAFLEGGAGTLHDSVFSNTAIAFSAAAPSACWPIQRGTLDTVVNPLVSSNGLNCLAPKVVLRTTGTTATDPTPPGP